MIKQTIHIMNSEELKQEQIKTLKSAFSFTLEKYQNAPNCNDESQHENILEILNEKIIELTKNNHWML